MRICLTTGMLPKTNTNKVTKSKLSLKSSRVSVEHEDTNSPLDNYTKTLTDGTKMDNKPIEKTDKKIDAKVPCVASLHNLGNTCFLNSVLQVLRYTPGFKEKISELAEEVKLSKKERQLSSELDQKDCAEDHDKDYTTWDVVIHLNQVFQKMNEAEEAFVNGSSFIGTRPYGLIDIIGLLNPMFEGDQQQDAHEFLRCLLGYVQDASHSLNRYRKKVSESLGRCMKECVMVEKSVLPSPKEVDMYGGARKPTKNKSSVEKNKLKLTTLGSRQTRRAESENLGNNLATLTVCRQGHHEQKLLTEIQNHDYLSLKSIMNCHGVKKDGDKERTVQDCCVGVRVANKTQDNTHNTNINLKPAGKRKASSLDSKVNGVKTHQENCSVLKANEEISVQKKCRLFESSVDADVRGESDHEKCTENIEKTNVFRHVCSEKPKDDTEISETVTKQLKDRQSAKNVKSGDRREKTSTVSYTTKTPVMKQLYVSLDKNGIEKYFKKVSKQQSTANIERHLEPVADCIEELFQGCVELWTRCCECEQVTLRREEYQDISVAIQQKPDKDDDWQDELRLTGENGEDQLSNELTVGKHENVPPTTSSLRSLRSSVSKSSVKSEESFQWIRDSLAEVEHLKDDSKYWCDGCCHLSEAERSMHYTSVPKILTLHLKRFAIQDGFQTRFTKLTQHMPLPMTLSCIEDHCPTPEQHRLRLYGVIMHTGSTLTGGHYTAYVQPLTNTPSLARLKETVGTKTDDTSNSDGTLSCEPAPASGIWFACDDETIMVLTDKEFHSQLSRGSLYAMTPYLLFYHRM